MHRKRTSALSIVALALIVGAAGMAQAQPGRRHHGRGPHVSVTGFEPLSGPPGTRVTVRGFGFSPQTQVRVGGRPVRLTSWSPTELTFTIPPRGRRYDIVVRAPGAPDIVVGTFTLAHDPVVTQVSSGVHRAGAQIRVTGRGFLPGDQLSVHGVALPIVRSSDDTILARIPAGARTGPLVLSRPSTGASWNTGVVIQIAAPAPVLESISPTSGPPGTRVRLTGSNFGPDATVYFGPIALQRVGAGRGFIDVVIPQNARRGDVLTVRDSHGSSAGLRFEVLTAPTIASVVARGVPQGVEVTITGSGFVGQPHVTVGPTVGRVVSSSPGRLVVIFPASVPATMPIVVRSNGQTVSSPHPLRAYRR